jgi:predicted HTH domain antitoxin
METIILQIQNQEDLNILNLLAPKLNWIISRRSEDISLTKNIIIPNEVLSNEKLSITDIQLEFSIYLYERKLITLEQGSKLANLDILNFQKELGKRKISIYYGIEGLEQDITNLQKLNRI